MVTTLTATTTASTTAPTTPVSVSTNEIITAEAFLNQKTPEKNYNKIQTITIAMEETCTEMTFKKPASVSVCSTTKKDETLTIGKGKCDHDKRIQYHMNDQQSYFTEEHYDRSLRPVTKCGGSNCKHVFGENYTVSTKTPVFVCTEAEKTVNTCIHALCSNCYSNLKTGARSNRTTSTTHNK